MLHEVSGDILLSKAQAIGHGVAPNDSFDSGLALALRENWPSLYKDFRHYCQTRHPQPGELWTWTSSEGQRVINLMTQDAAYDTGAKPGKATVERVNHTLRALRKLVEEEKIASLALPRLATGVGGLDWKDVSPLVARHLGDLTIPVYVYATYRKGVSAEEPAAR
jgi:O-acetyl-ADP-ribose deacetylase (regulator of RNase III)